jgi:phosphopantothenoylcysteine synthetase/decarboxylase
MRILVTAGNTLVPIDSVRCITNIFTGRTGAQIARQAVRRGHAVTLLTSHPEGSDPSPAEMKVYHTFEDLRTAIAEAIRPGGVDVIIHSAAVSDYQSAGIFAPGHETRFDPETGRWLGPSSVGAELVDVRAAKIKSDAPELWLRLVRTPKLVDLVRSDWGFRGILVKFKLEASVSDEKLLAIAEASRRRSAADLMVANTLEGSKLWAFVGPVGGAYERVSRQELPGRLLDAIEHLQTERTHG